jgi:hypothetical protein
MAKDIKNDDLLEWDTYAGKSVEKTLPEIYKHAKNLSVKARNWYWSSIKSKRRFSLGIRTIILIFLVCGGVLPVIAGSLEETKLRLLFTQYGVAALAVAGLLQVADRIFGFSSGWIRYISTVLAMEDLTRKFELDWADYLLSKNQNIEDCDKKPLFDLAKRFEEEILKKQIEETEKWVAEFNNANTLLSELIKSQRETAEKIYSEEKERSEKKKKEQAEPDVDLSSIELTNAQVAKLAVLQNEKILKAEFPNIMSVSDSVDDLSLSDSHVVTLYLKDNKVEGIPHKLKVRMPDKSFRVIRTEVVAAIGEGGVHYLQDETSLANAPTKDYQGSFCCIVHSKVKPRFSGLVTAAHIYTLGRYTEEENGFFDLSEANNVLLDGRKSGKWFYKLLTYNQDLAIVQIDPEVIVPENYRLFENHYYTIRDSDVKAKEPNVTIVSKVSKTRNAFVLDFGIGLYVRYYNGLFYKKNIILIGTTNQRDDSKPVSVKGDSGGCVYKRDTNLLIGIILGGDDKFTYVLPVEETLQSKNFITV